MIQSNKIQGNRKINTCIIKKTKTRNILMIRVYQRGRRVIISDQDRLKGKGGFDQNMVKENG